MVTAAAVGLRQSPRLTHAGAAVQAPSLPTTHPGPLPTRVSVTLTPNSSGTPRPGHRNPRLRSPPAAPGWFWGWIKSWGWGGEGIMEVWDTRRRSPSGCAWRWGHRGPRTLGVGGGSMGRAGGPSPPRGFTEEDGAGWQLAGDEQYWLRLPKKTAALGTPKLAAPTSCLPHPRAGTGPEELLVWVLLTHRAHTTQGIVRVPPPPPPGGFGVLAHGAQGKQEAGSWQVPCPRQKFHCHHPPRSPSTTRSGAG